MCASSQKYPSPLIHPIVSYSLKTKKRQFLIKWKGYSEFTNSWESEEHLDGCKEMIAEYLQSREEMAGKRRVLALGDEDGADDLDDFSDSEIFSVGLDNKKDKMKAVLQKTVYSLDGTNPLALSDKERLFLGTLFHLTLS